MNENISDDEGGDSYDPFDPNVTDQDDSEEDDPVKPTMTPLRVRGNELFPRNFCRVCKDVSPRKDCRTSKTCSKCGSGCCTYTPTSDLSVTYDVTDQLSLVTSLVTKQNFWILFPKITVGDIPVMLSIKVNHNLRTFIQDYMIEQSRPFSAKTAIKGFKVKRS